MANSRITLRDIDLFASLDRSPLTVRQLRAISRSFPSPFGSDRRMQDRLVQLTRAGLLRRHRYATTEGIGQYYYTLSPESYRLLHGMHAVLPSAGVFQEIGVSRQHHTHCLAEVIVRTVTAAAEAGVQVEEFRRENSLRLMLDDESLYPDCAFTLRIPERPGFTFYVELDNSTEPLASPRAHDSWLKKLRFYEKLQDGRTERFRVLGIVTKSPQRLDHLVALAAAEARNTQRSLFYGVDLRDYLTHPTPLFSTIFRDHRGQPASILPITMHPARTSPAKIVAPAAAV